MGVLGYPQPPTPPTLGGVFLYPRETVPLAIAWSVAMFWTYHVVVKKFQDIDFTRSKAETPTPLIL